MTSVAAANRPARSPGAAPTDTRAARALAAVRGAALLAVLVGAAHATWLLTTLPTSPRGALELGLASIGAELGLTLLATPLVALFAVAFPGFTHPSCAASLRTLTSLVVLIALELGVAWSLLAWATTHDLAQVTRRAGITLLAALAACTALWLARRTRLLAPSSAPARTALLLRAAHWLAWLTPLALHLALPASLLAHDGVRLGLTAALLVPLAPRLAARFPAVARRVVLGLGALALAWTLLGTRRDPDTASALLTRHEPLRVWISLVAPLGDLDGDGASILFGGSDCAPFDRFIGPDAPELAGNGVDDNCLLGDLDDDGLAPLPPFGPAWLADADLLILSVDALRPDRMSLLGYPRATTPNLARHFADAFNFTHAYAEAASTRDTLPSLLSGRRIFDLRWHLDDAIVLDPQTRHLGDFLAPAGYRSWGALPFTAVNMIGTTRLGLDALHIYDDHDGRGSTAAAVTDAVLAAHAELPGPRLLFAHYYEPHEPHVPQRPFRDVSRDPYDQEIARVDAEIGRLLDTLADRGALARTIVVLTADHGEAFDEHGHSFHNTHVFDEDLRVPLLLRVPGHPGRTIPTPASNTQLAATLLELVGAPAPARDGPTSPSLVPLLRGAPPDPTFTISGSARALTSAGKWMLRRGDLKVIFDAVAHTEISFDLAADPGETTPAPPQPELVADFRERELGAARSRALRAARIGDASTTLDPHPLPGLTLVDAHAELVDALDAHPRLPARVLVRVRFDLGDARPDDFTYAVQLRRGNIIRAQVSEPIAGGRTSLRSWPAGARIEDVRSFKVPRDQLDAEIIVLAGPHELRLGRVDAQPVAAR